jgi:hypothetical protein
VRRVVLIVLGLGLLAVATAVAQSSGDDYQLQEPSVSSAQVLRLPSDSSCVRFTRATVRFLPPPGAVFGVLQVTADGAEAARLTGVPRAASATVRLTGARTVVRASGTTLGGQNIGATRSYRRCGVRTSKPKAKPRSKPRARPRAKPRSAPTPPPTEIGGGEDG